MNPILDDIILIPYLGSCEECCLDVNGAFTFSFYIFTVNHENNLERHTIDIVKITPSEELLQSIQLEKNLQEKHFLANFGKDFCKINLKCEYQVIPSEHTTQIKAILFDSILRFEIR